MKEYVRTPLNYTGNKIRILDQIQPYFPKEINIMVDLFCGGATVGLNTECKEVYFIDNDPMVIGLLTFLNNCEYDKLIKELEIIISNYGLSNSYRNGYKVYREKIKDSNINNGLKEYNKAGFYKLRENYNKLKNKHSHKAFCMLYILLLYGFNNDLRFNNKNEFNLPVGKTDFNKANVEKLNKYLTKITNVNAHYLCSSFDSEEVKHIIDKADAIYMDPPYLITNATYNESNRWNNDYEHKLLDFVDRLIEKKKNFVLSNVIEKKNRKNEPLCYWVKKRSEYIDIVHINYNYRSSSYNKKIRDSKEDEIIIKLKKVSNENK